MSAAGRPASGATSEELNANLVLASLDAADQESLAGAMRRVRLSLGEVIFVAGERLRGAWFPLTGVISLVTGSGTGSQVEVAIVGNEGMVGLPLIFGGRDSGNLSAVCQVPSDCLTVSAVDLGHWLEGHEGGLPKVLNAYTRLQLIDAAQAVLCGRLHQLEERCARWLLLTHDRAMVDQFPITHEFLAHMLGVRRASVTLAARRLRKRGLIAYSRGRVQVLDRRQLEEAACECYGVMRAAQDQLLPPPKESPRRPPAPTHFN